ncbi:MAG: condensation domain-containing protein, partial [Gemmatimonadaceae bacterium]
MDTAAPDSEEQTRAFQLAPMQESMLFHWLRGDCPGIDVEQISWRMNGVDIPRFIQAWGMLLERTPALRLKFIWEGVSAPLQVPDNEAKLVTLVEDIRGKSAAEQRTQFESYTARDRAKKFDLGVAPLFRLAFFRTSDDEVLCLWTLHHIILDGRGFVLVLRELFDVYRALETGSPVAAPKNATYESYIKWLQRQDCSQALTYWKKQLLGYEAPAFPDLGAVWTGATPDEYAQQQRRLNLQATERLKAFARANELTVNTLVQGAWALMLGRYANLDDVVFGST